MGQNRRIRKERRRQRFIALSLILVICVGGYVLSLLYEQGERLKVTFVPVTPGRPSTYCLEFADSAAKREKGLMFRKSIEQRGGMFFLGDEDKIQKFWMVNTFIPLDMIFVDKDKKVVGVLESVPILNEQPRFVDQPSRHVIELAAGSARRDGITVGSTVQFDLP